MEYCVAPPVSFTTGYSVFGMRLSTIILGLLLTAGCNNSGTARSSSPVQARLQSAVASGAASFDFAADSNFAWDRMYVFAPYSNQAFVEKALGFKWPGFRKTTIESSDNVALVVFVRNGEVVSWYEQPRSIDLSGLANDKGYLRSEARFGIERGGSRAELKPNTSSRRPTTAG